MDEKMPSQESVTESADLIKTTTRRKARTAATQAKEKKEKEARTEPKKKDLELYTDPKTHLIRIRFIGGGQLPRDLDTAFIKPFHAERAIEQYLKARRT